MNGFGLKQLIEGTTRYDNNNTCIDLIFTNSDCTGILHVGCFAWVFLSDVISFNMKTKWPLCEQHHRGVEPAFSVYYLI